MKKLLLILLTVTALSCNKNDCNCGEVVVTAFNSTYTATITNNCTGNKKVFTYSKEEWDDLKVRRQTCMTEPW